MIVKGYSFCNKEEKRLTFETGGAKNKHKNKPHTMTLELYVSFVHA